MARHYIDFISAYCDTWCERCPFTERCSHFAVTSALAMCDDDMTAAIELAIGAPRVPGEKAQQKIADRMAEALDGYEEPTKKELDQIGCEMEERRKRVERHVLAEASYDYAVAAGRWFEKHDVQVENSAPRSTAVEIIQRDMFLIHVKIMRALTGRDEDPKGRIWNSRVQNDWNGSAKVALISIERSEAAWREIAPTLADEAATVLADTLARLRNEVTSEFPRAMEFRRPGFDDRQNADPSPPRSR